MLFFFFNDTATTEIYTLSLHDALPILRAVTEDDLLAAPVGVDRLLRGPTEVEPVLLQGQVLLVPVVVELRKRRRSRAELPDRGLAARSVRRPRRLSERRAGRHRPAEQRLALGRPAHRLDVDDALEVAVRHDLRVVRVPPLRPVG